MTERLSRVDGAVVAPGTASGGEPRLVVPEGWVIDEAAHDRLLRQLDRAPSHIAGVVAEVGQLPPGASYRVHAEWRSLEAPSAMVEHPSTRVRGAVLLRAGVEFQARGEHIEVDAGPLLLDPGATVHDPWRSIGPLLVASELGRPPFSRRPVVVFVANECDEDLADWARRLVNRLVRRDVEARLALPQVPAGLQITRSCMPCEESIRALTPDIVVALDEAAMVEAPRWCGADRSTVIVEFVDDVALTTQLVSWQIGRASGRLRARIGRRVDAPALVALVNRLCAGPHPMPPSDHSVLPAPRVGTRESRTGQHRARAQARSAVVLTGTLGPSISLRVEGLRDHLEALGRAVEVAPLDRETPASARSADLLMLVDVDDLNAVHDVVDARRSTGHATVVDVSAEHLNVDSTVSDSEPSLSAGIAQVATACGLATSAGGAMDTAVRRLGVRSHTLPTLLARTRLALLEARSRGGLDAPSERIVGWQVGSPASSERYHDAVTEALTKVLADHADVHVEVVGDRDDMPRALRDHDRVTITREVVPETYFRWILHVWTPLLLGGEVADDQVRLMEAGCTGVPSVVPAASRNAIDGHVAPELMVTGVDRPEEWATALHDLLDDERLRAQRARETLRQSGALYGAAVSRAVVNRFLGWALHGRTA